MKVFVQYILINVYRYMRPCSYHVVFRICILYHARPAIRVHTHMYACIMHVLVEPLGLTSPPCERPGWQRYWPQAQGGRDGRSGIMGLPLCFFGGLGRSKGYIGGSIEGGTGTYRKICKTEHRVATVVTLHRKGYPALPHLST